MNSFKLISVKFSRFCKWKHLSFSYYVYVLQVDYVVDYHFSINGSNRVTLEGGHTGVVKSVLPMSGKQIGTTQSQGIFGCTPFNLFFFSIKFFSYFEWSVKFSNSGGVNFLYHFCIPFNFRLDWNFHQVVTEKKKKKQYW